MDISEKLWTCGVESVNIQQISGPDFTNFGHFKKSRVFVKISGVHKNLGTCFRNLWTFAKNCGVVVTNL